MRPIRFKVERRAITVLLVVFLCLTFYFVQSPAGPISRTDKFLEWVKSKPQMDDPAFVDFVRKEYLVPWNKNAYNLSKPSRLNPSDGQIQSILHLLNGTNISKDPFFVEAGAYDGEWLSNTLFLEHTLGWDGVLIEPDRLSFPKLLAKNRKAWHVNACLSTRPYPTEGTFFRWPDWAIFNSLFIIPNHNLRRDKIPVQCLPFYTILLALNRTLIDLLSLDVEGAELDVLRTIPFHKVLFKILILEIGNVKVGGQVERGTEAIKTLMSQNGYKLIGTVQSGSADDLIFTHDQDEASINYV